MKSILLLLGAAFLLVQCSGNDIQTNSVEFAEKIESNFIAGHLDRYLFKPEDLTERFVDVWIPESYEQDTEYSVIYMHDGQMLFDESSTWNSQEW
ncbi:MAG: alpha/beta hydrolase, partial [Bacteroidota bacterium]